MRPALANIQIAARKLSAIPFFPTDEFARESIMDELAAYVRDAVALDWLVRSAVAGMRQWQGPAELRALYCTRYKPLDGIEGHSCTIVGHTPEHSEGRPVLGAATNRYLPAPDDFKISDEERRQMDALNEKISLQVASENVRRRGIK